MNEIKRTRRVRLCPSEAFYVPIALARWKAKEDSRIPLITMEKDKAKETPEPTEAQKEDNNSSLEREIAAGEWQRLKTFVTYQKRTRQGKILASYQAIANRLAQLSIVFMHLVRDNPQGAQKLLEEIKNLRRIQDFLSECLIWEKKGEEIDLPEEIVDILGE